MPTTTENNYRTILQRISAFGGVQIFNILISLVKSKFVAVFLGPDGMGISSLYTSSIGTLQQMAGLGLNMAIVKESAEHKNNTDALPAVLATAIRLITLTSLLGAVICFLLSPLLSLWTFGSADYTVGFMALSLTCALTIAYTGYLSLLQGLGAVKRLTKASLIGGLTGLCIGVPLYYFFGFDGIVPAMTALAASQFIFYYVSFRQMRPVKSARFIWVKHKPLVFKLLRTGIVLMAGALAGTLTSYLINTFIRSYGTMADVGLFQAANSLTNQYVGIIISALALDFFPRLSAAVNEPDEFNAIVNRQIEIICLIMTPLIICLILTAPWVIRLLLTAEFLSITELMRWMGLGMFIQTLSYPIGYIYLAKIDSRIYFWLEVVMGNVLWLACSVVLYYLFGLIGLGISIVVRCLLGDPVFMIVAYKRFGFRLDHIAIKNMILAIVLTAGAFAASFHPLAAITVLPILLIGSVLFSFITLKRKI
ncbi:MAG: O-antigen translocase [Muribaculaceae bacterium]|nr:O-antigen translocase [Muribaculaceae bacterium]